MYIIIGLSVGLLVGVFTPLSLPVWISPYMVVLLLTCLDCVAGGIKAMQNDDFEIEVFLSGFLGNALLAVGITALGQWLGLELYLATALIFGMRLFHNFAEIRRALLTQRIKTSKIEKY